MISGKGMWIWQIRECCGGDLSEIVAKAERAGLSHILIKVGDGVSAYGGAPPIHLAARLAAAGIEPIAWAYSRAADPRREASLFWSRTRSIGARCLVLDAEKEYETPGARVRALDLIEGLRAQAPDLQLGLSSYYLPKMHPAFPWAAFSDVDVVMPQVYWYDHEPSTALARSVAQYERLYPDKAIIPTGAVYPEGMGDPAQLQRFLEAVNALHLPAVNFWSWQHCPGPAWTMIRDFEFAP